MKNRWWGSLSWWAKTCWVSAGFVTLMLVVSLAVLRFATADPAGSLPGFTVPLTHALFPLFIVVLLTAFARVHSNLSVRRSGRDGHDG
ncbi:MAG: hypothetical protein AAFO68_09525 [Pseudomonadota bacterium]